MLNLKNMIFFFYLQYHEWYNHSTGSSIGTALIIQVKISLIRTLKEKCQFVCDLDAYISVQIFKI